MPVSFAPRPVAVSLAPAPVPVPRRRVIVLGAGVAGLLAARVLAERFSEVVILDRDALPERAETRAGAPQADHVHILLARGQALLEAWFPGLGEDLAAAGAVEVDWTADCAMLGAGGWNPRFASGLVTSTCSRSLLEWQLRDRLAAWPQIKIVSGVRVLGCVAGSGTKLADHQRVVGVRAVLPESGQTVLRADLVVDATGRGSRTPEWLQELGFAPAPEATIDARLGYASRWYHIPPQYQTTADPAWKSLLIWAKPPLQTRAGVLYPVEGNRWVVTLSGTNGDHPPGDEAGFLAFARSLRDPAIYEAIAQAKPCSEIKLFRGTANRWRHYEQLDRFPAGLVVLGDAAGAFNPLYGQGMTAAALGAEVLGATIDRCSQGAGGRLDLDRLSQDFRRRLAGVLSLPWLMATGEDLRWSGTLGDRPNWAVRSLQTYLDRVLHLTDSSPWIHETVWKVQHMVVSPLALVHPAIAVRVLGAHLGNGLRRFGQPRRRAWAWSAPCPSTKL